MIGGIGNWLKKRVDDVQGAFGVSNTAQTFKTNTPKAAPARTISRQPQPQQFSQPAQTNKITNDVNSVMQPRFNLNQSLQNNGVNTQPKVQQPKTTQQLVNDSYGSGFSGLINRGKDILDPNTEADRIKRQAQSGLNETHEQQQSRLTNTATSAQTNRSIGQQGAASFGREALNFVGKAQGAIGNIGGSIMQSKNPVVKTLRSAVPVLNAASVADAQTGGAGGREVQRMSNNANKFIDNKVGQSRFGERQGENKWAVGGGQMAAQLPLQIATGGAGLVSTGAQMASDEYNKAREAGKSNDAALGIGLLQGGASALSEKIGVDRFIPGNNVAGSSLVRAAKRFLTEGTQEAQQQFTQNLITNKTYNPNQSLREGIGESFLLGGAVGGATSGLLDAPDVFNNRTPLNEGGYIAGPLAPDFSKAQAEGKVFEGVDGKPRFEVDDSGAKIKNPNGKTLGELLDHPKLFEQYDSLKNLPVKTFTDSDSRLSGAYDYENKSMELNLADRNPLGALLHELQHAVQDIEGTATGTSLYRAGEYRNKKLREHNSNLTTEETYKRQEKINQEVDAVKAARRKEGSPLSHDETTALYTKLRNKYFGRPSKYGKLTDFDVYERHAGEAEARAVEARMNMPMSERYVKPETLYHGTGKDFKQFGLNAETKQARADIAKLNAERNKLVDSGKVVDNALTIPPQAQKRIAQIDQEIQAIYQRPNIMPSNVKEKGVYLTSDKNYAKTFAGKDGRILETTADLKKPYIIKNQDEMDLIEDAAYYPDIIKGLEADGYDGIKALDGQVLVFDTAKVKIGTPKPRSTFYDSLDVPKEDLIVRNEGGKAMSIDDPLAALKQEANQLKTPRGNLQDALQPDTAYSDMLRGIEAQTQQPQVFDPELKKLERQKQQIIDAEARAKYEASKQLAQDQKDLRKTIRASGGIGSSDYETLPSGLKRKNGRALDDLATELGFESDQALVDELTTHTQPERLKDLREVVEHEMKNGKSELSGDYKNLLKAIDDRHAELLRYPEGAKVVKNTQEFPSLDEFNSLLSTPEAQSNSNKTKQAVSAATADLRKQQFDAVVKGDLDTADQVRKKIGEIETGLKRTAPEPTVLRGNIEEALSPKPVSYIPRSLNDFDKMIGGTGNIESEVRNDAATMSTVGKDAKALLESIQGDNEVTKAARKAMEDGSEIHYYAKKDANGRSVGIERFNPKNMKIEAGFVTDNDGNVLGNHIKVDDTGIQINVGGNLVNLNSVIGNPLDWQGQYRISETMERNIKRNAPTPEIAEKTQRFLIAAKTKREAQFREELQSVRNEFAQLDKATMAVKPKGVKDKAYRADLMDYFENNMSDQDFKGKYGEAALIQATVAKNKTRAVYDQLLDRVNEEFGKFGEKQVDRRKDYITHINELNGRPSFAGELYGRLQNSILGEGSAQNRSGLPGDIAGRTENFEPRKRWNQFFQARKGGEYTKDPFKAIDAYLEPSLYNIHMTEPAVRARAVESAFRTAEQIKNTTSEGLTKQLNDSLARYRDTTGNTKLVIGFQEYANALAGKTQKLDRDIIDMSKSTELGLRGWQSLQGIAGKATILGNINSVVSQTLGLPSAVADAGVKNYVKGIAASISNDGSIKKSPFIKARETNVDSRFRSKTQKVMNVGGIPIQVVELAMVKQTWQAEHAKVKSEGYKGMDAVLEADRRTERVVAGRGIADKPELYRSTAMNGLMEYTLEAEAQFKNFTQDLNPKQKATFIVAAFAMNSLSELVTGNTPLPDFLGAAIDSLGDIFGEDKEGAEKLTSPLQRFASEAVSFNPLVTAGVNALTTKDMRKSLFGEDSNLGRYDGTSAPVQVIKNAYNAVDSAANGEWTNARNEALKDLPFGNQIRKSLTGLEANMRGSAVDKSGEKTFETGKNAGSQLRNFLFGANSTKEAREYYDKPKGSDSKPTGGNLLSTDELLKEQMSSPEQQDFLKLKSDEQKELAKSDPKAKAWLEQIKTTKRINADDVERPEGLSAESKRILEWDNKRTQEQKNRLQYTQNDYDYKLAKAKYEQDKLKGNVSRAEQINRDQSLKKAEIGSQFSKDTREAYNSLTKAELQAYAEQDPNGNQIWNDAVAYGDKLVEAGLLKKNKLRTASKGGGRKGKGGRKGTTAKYKSGAGSSNDISKKLQQLAFGSSKSKSGSSAPKKHAAKLKGVRSA